ncbi:hypothetical protein JN01_0320 [Entomoplasma freundtii]|uniref:Uncharacterized protein n=1 Tax=Entomoplasma freundtii TaxID=74700 RepID=A0A2K8NR53_9MOLU|nr:hypothetical protein [Entomoplasma freundtii]ATZ16267.1 hypothetical protein EFREU_v1c02400 [Entomoplasma freundtii]TDY56832.1 hypothetical protein JN01_0320 [Entomoplasma freundtii]
MKFWYFLFSLFSCLTPIFNLNYPIAKNQFLAIANSEYQFEDEYFSKPFINVIDYQKDSPTYPKLPSVFVLLFREHYNHTTNWELPAEDVSLAKSNFYQSELRFNFSLFWETPKGNLEVKNLPMTIDLTNFQGHLVVKSPELHWVVRYKNQPTIFWHEITFSLEKNNLIGKHVIQSNIQPYNSLAHNLSFSGNGLKYVQILINNLEIRHYLPPLFKALKQLTLIMDLPFSHQWDEEYDAHLQTIIRESVLYNEYHFSDYFSWPIFTPQQKKLLQTIGEDGLIRLRLELTFQKNPALKVLAYYLPSLKLDLEINQKFNLPDLIDSRQTITYSKDENPWDIFWQLYEPYKKIWEKNCLFKQENNKLIIEAKKGQEKVTGLVVINIERKILKLASLKPPKLKVWVLSPNENGWERLNEALFQNWQASNTELASYDWQDFTFEWASEKPQVGLQQVVIKGNESNPFLEGQLIYHIKIESNEKESKGDDTQIKPTKIGFGWWWLVLPIIVLLIGLGLIIVLKRRKNASRDPS